eukprot:gene38400-43500_t
MRERIVRHQADRAERVPSLRTIEDPVELARAIVTQSTPESLVLVDCLTMWLTNLLMPLRAEGARPVSRTPAAHVNLLLGALRDARGPVVLVGNEIGLGVIPLGRRGGGLPARHADDGRIAADAEGAGPMKKFFAAALAALALGLGLWTSPASALEVVDERGVSVELPQPPQRIVTLLPSLTESVCALGACARLVGVDRYSNSPVSVRTLPQLGGGIDPNVEAVVALRPDVVLLAKSSRVTERLE